jgi:hypothetical protein
LGGEKSHTSSSLLKMVFTLFRVTLFDFGL